MAIIVSDSNTSTVQSLITLALKDIGYLGPNETINPVDLGDAFATFKQMLGQWQVDGMMIYATEQIVVPATGAQSYTLGDGADIDVTRPAEVTFAFHREGDVDSPLEVLSAVEHYQAITNKTQAGSPQAVFYSPTYPNGTLYVWPLPSSGAIHLTVRQSLPSFSSVTNDLSLPPEYQFAVRFGLAEVLSATFNTPLRPDIAQLAAKARKVLKRGKVKIPTLGMPPELLRHRFDVVSGE